MKHRSFFFARAVALTFAVAATGTIVAGCNTRTGAQQAGQDAPAAASAELTTGGGESDTAAGTGAESAAVTETVPPPQTSSATPVVQTPAVQSAVAMQNAFAQVARAAEPAVVTITTEASGPIPVRERTRPFGGPGGGGPSPFGEGDGFEEFFRRFGRRPAPGFGPGAYHGPKPGAGLHPTQDEGGDEPRGGGLGSGLIYDASGLVMTNAHVVGDADSVTVRLADKREIRAKVVGRDPRTDIAVVKIPAAANLPTVKFGDSSKVQVGDWAIAVGNPFGLEQTLTVGVISAKAREIPLTVSGPSDYLQTDASINPGNSGGPLLDIYGRVIGVNNTIYSRSGGNVGIGFAIPINTAREIAGILAREGRVRRARLGVAVTNLENRAAAFGVPAGTPGVLVEGVDPGSPAARAGLQPGDVIQRLNDTPITRSVDFQRLVSRSTPGSEARLSLLRAGQTRTITARLEELRDESARPRARRLSSEGAVGGGQSAAPGGSGRPTPLGIGVAAITPDVAQRAGIPASLRGVLIGSVEPNGPADRAGLQPGDVIERVGQTPVATPPSLQSAVRALLDRQTGSDRSVALYVNRRGERRFVVVNAR